LEFNYAIEYKQGKENRAADALSRRDLELQAITIIKPSWTASVEASYKNDAYCQELLQKLTVAPTAQPNMTLQAGILRYKGRLFIGSDDNLKQQILHSMHASAIGGHSVKHPCFC
jgi:hypothetical protein